MNPVRGTYLNGKYYDFEPGSFRESIALKNSVTPTQNSTTFSALGGTLPAFSIALMLDNTYNVKLGTIVGETTWLGVSRLADLKSDLSVQSASLPITFVTPYGATYSVVPTGAIDITEHLPVPQDAGVEFRVSINLEAQS